MTDRLPTGSPLPPGVPASAPPGAIVVYSTVWCPDCRRAKRFLAEHRVPFVNVDIEHDPAARAYVGQINGGKHIIPTLLFPDGSHLVEPSNAALAAKLGLQTKASRRVYDVLVVGAGPAGLTAAVYLAREGLETLVIERAGLGGQVGNSQWIENFPGFDEGISGADFAERLSRQARRFGAEVLQAQSVSRLKRDEACLSVTTADGSVYDGSAVVLATGARYRRLGVPGEDNLIGSSVHFCAVCDGAFYQGKRVLVVGGGNSGFEEGMFLTRFAERVDIVELLPQVRASRVLQDQVARHPRMSVATGMAVQAFKGHHSLEAVVLRDQATGEQVEKHYDGVFIFIGLDPNSEMVRGQVELDAGGFVVTDKGLMTQMPGLFAAGDVRAGSSKQAAAAVGEGATAALHVRDYLAGL